MFLKSVKFDSRLTDSQMLEKIPTFTFIMWVDASYDDALMMPLMKKSLAKLKGSYKHVQTSENVVTWVNQIGRAHV